MSTKKQRSKLTFVLVSGRAGVGKSTVCKQMHDYLHSKGEVSATIPVARSLKQFAMLLGWNGEKDDAGRKLLQNLGTVGRDFDADVWIKSTFEKKIPELISSGIDFVLVDDWRFKNELNYLKANPSVVVFTVRIESPEREALKNTPLYNDVSEISLPSAFEKEGDDFYDAIIVNKESLDTLNIHSQTLVEYILDHTPVWE